MKTKSFLKSIMAFTILLAVLGIAVVSCEKEDNTTETNQEIANKELKVPSNIVPIEKAIKEYNNFYNTRVTPLKSQINEKENRSVWFSKKSLENYIDLIEQKSAEKRIALSGINFVFAIDQNNKHTLFLAPTTYESKLNYHKSFSINNGEILHINQIKDIIATDSNIKSNNTHESLLMTNKGIIGNTEAINMFNTYYETRVKPFKNEMEFDTKAIWYSIEEIRDYMNYIEAVTENTNATTSGFEVVFSTYDDNTKLGVKSNKKTIFLLPTVYLSENKQHKAYFIQGNNLIFLNLDQNLLNKNLIDVTSDQVIFSTAVNRGQLNPPPVPS